MRVSHVGASWAETTIRLVTPSASTRRRQPTSARLFLLDGHSLAYRAFFALPPTLATSSGTVTNAVYGFTSMLIKLLAEEKPDLIAVFFDSGAPTVRLAKDADYKAGRRETPQDFRPQLGLIEEVLEALRIPVLRIADGNEADDAIGTLAMRAGEQGIDATIVTADRDFFQLVRDGITVMFNRKGISDIVRYDEAAVTERFGITPGAVPRLRGAEGRHQRQHPRGSGRGGQDRRQAGQPVRHGGGAGGHTPTSSRASRRRTSRPAPTAWRSTRSWRRSSPTSPLPVTPDDCVMGDWDTERGPLGCSPRWSSGACSTGCRRSATPSSPRSRSPSSTCARSLPTSSRRRGRAGAPWASGSTPTTMPSEGCRGVRRAARRPPTRR